MSESRASSASLSVAVANVTAAKKSPCPVGYSKARASLRVEGLEEEQMADSCVKEEEVFRRRPPSVGRTVAARAPVLRRGCRIRCTLPASPPTSSA